MVVCVVPPNSHGAGEKRCVHIRTNLAGAACSAVPKIFRGLMQVLVGFM
jgi:hypothetical protein